MTTKKFLGEVHEKTKKNEQKNRQKKYEVIKSLYAN